MILNQIGTSMVGSQYRRIITIRIVKF
jgi:hypothetical protein